MASLSKKVKPMRKLKKKRLTKAEKQIAELTAKLANAQDALSTEQYQHRKTKGEKDEYETRAAKEQQQARDYQRRYDIISSEIREVTMELQAVEASDQSSSMLQRVIGVAQGRLMAINNLTQYARTDTYKMVGR